MGKKNPFKTALFLLKLKGIECKFLNRHECFKVGFPCCFFCERLEECYEESKYLPTNYIICKFDKGICFCRKVRDELHNFLTRKKE